MKKDYIIFITGLFLLLVFMLILMARASSSTYRASSSTDEVEEIEVSYNVPFDVSSDVRDIYKVTDIRGVTFYFLLNYDKTAQVKTIAKDGTEIIWYCSWYNFSSEGRLEINFSGHDGAAIMYNKSSWPEAHYCLYIKDGWLYREYDECKAKNPEWRVEAEKIK